MNNKNLNLHCDPNPSALGWDSRRTQSETYSQTRCSFYDNLANFCCNIEFWLTVSAKKSYYFAREKGTNNCLVVWGKTDTDCRSCGIVAKNGFKYCEQVNWATCSCTSNCQSKYQCCSERLRGCHLKNIRFDCTSHPQITWSGMEGKEVDTSL